MKVLYTFGVGSVHDGCQPTGPLVRDTEGNLFGTTAASGEENQGTVFKIDASGHETVLLSFIHSKTGGTPSGGLVRDSAGNLYGTTFWGGGTDICGGGGCGTVFKIAP